MIDKVSVVVVNYNGERYLDVCLSAVARLEGPVDEVLVVDNASTDASRALLAERFPQVRVIALERNDGPCPARNAGMRAARNRWVLALDNDAIVLPDVLVKLAREVREGVALVQPRSVFHSDPERVHYDGGGLHYVGLIALRNFYAPLSSASGARVEEVDCAVAVALLVDRELVLDCGGYDARYFILFEDLDLSYRLRARGLKILSVADALVQHMGGTSGISFREGPSYPARRVFLHSRNRWMHLAKNHAAWTLVVSAPGLLLYELVAFAFACAAGSPLAWLRGKLEFLELLPGLLRDRRAVQSRRTLRDARLLRGGPLALTPALSSSAPRAFAQRCIDLALRGWWRCARLVLPG